jgi:hypothetical protein
VVVEAAAADMVVEIAEAVAAAVAIVGKINIQCIFKEALARGPFYCFN